VAAEAEVVVVEARWADMTRWKKMEYFLSASALEVYC
jgi:hypothetical protein